MAVAKPITASCPQEDLTRRNLLMALPFAGAALTLPALPKAEEGNTEILRLFRQREAILLAARDHVCAGTSNDEDAEFDDLFYQHTGRIEAQMMALPSTCAADMAAKMLVAHSDGELSCLHQDNPAWVEARKLTGGVA